MMFTMLAFREMLKHIRDGFPSRWTSVLTIALLTILDFVSFVGLIWWFILRAEFSLLPEILTVLAVIYLGCTGILAIMAFGFGKLRSVRAAVLFYLSIGLFFLLAGLLESSGKTFSPLPWVILWVFTLGVVLSSFSGEFYGKEKSPKD